MLRLLLNAKSSDRDIVLNDPVNMIDPTGEVGILETIFVVGTVSTIYGATKFAIGFKKNWNLQKDVLNVFNNAIKLLSIIDNKLDDPCLSNSQRNDLEKMRDDTDKQIEFLLKLQVTLGGRHGSNLYNYQSKPGLAP